MAKAIKYTIKYNANGGTGSMKDTVVTYGKGQKLRKNSFKKTYYDFQGWHAHRKSDDKWLYTNNKNEKWYKKGKQPDGYSLYLYKDCQTVSKTSNVNGDIVWMNAVWKLHVYKKLISLTKKSWYSFTIISLPSYFHVTTNYLEEYTQTKNTKTYLYRSVSATMDKILCNNVRIDALSHPVHTDNDGKTIKTFNWLKPQSVIYGSNIISHKSYYNKTSVKYNKNKTIYVYYSLAFVYNRASDEDKLTVPPLPINISQKIQ